MLITVDWGAVSNVLVGLGAIGAPIAVCWVAERGFTAWRFQKNAEQKRDVAEEVLSAAYKARRALRAIRSPLMSGRELEIAKQKLDEHSPDWRKGTPDNKHVRLVMAQG